MRFVAGRGALAATAEAPWRSAIGKLLAEAPWRRCCWPGHRSGAADLPGRRGSNGRGTVAEVLLAGAPWRRHCWPGHRGSNGRSAVTERYREDAEAGGATKCEMRVGPQKKRMTFVCDGHPLSILLSPLAILNYPFYQARLAAPRIAASDSFSDEGKTFTFPRQNETTSSSIYF